MLGEGFLAELKILLKEVTERSNASVSIPCKYYFVVDDGDEMVTDEGESLIVHHTHPQQSK